MGIADAGNNNLAVAKVSRINQRWHKARNSFVSITNRDILSAATAEYSLVHGQNEGALKSTRHQTHASVPEELWAPDTLEGLLLVHLRYAVHVHDFTTDPPIPTKICLSTFYNTTVNRHLFEK